MEEGHYTPMHKSWHSCATGHMASARQNNGNQWKETGMCDCTSQPSSFKVLGTCEYMWRLWGLIFKFCSVHTDGTSSSKGAITEQLLTIPSYTQHIYACHRAFTHWSEPPGLGSRIHKTTLWSMVYQWIWTKNILTLY